MGRLLRLCCPTGDRFGFETMRGGRRRRLSALIADFVVRQVDAQRYDTTVTKFIETLKSIATGRLKKQAPNRRNGGTS